MRVNAFYTTGNQDIIEWEYDKPECGDEQIEVRSIYTGMCSSDVAMYNGTFQTLPKEIQGHEGLGQVTDVGSLAGNFRLGDLVATRGEPAFADYYNCDGDSAVVVPAIDSKYILEPVACASNIANSFNKMQNDNVPVLILGSGWLATVVYQLLDIWQQPVTVVGAANKDFWRLQKSVEQITADELEGRQWSNVIDLSDKVEYLHMDLLSNSANVIIAAEKSSPMITTFDDFLWKGITVSFPSPRTDSFDECMWDALYLVDGGHVDLRTMWSHKYNRSDVVEAFKEASARTNNYKRGYIEWPDQAQTT